MHTPKLILLAVVVFIVVSCQKEVSFDNGITTLPGGGNSGGGGGGNTSGSLLVKRLSSSAADSIVEIFGYNTAKKIIYQQYIQIDKASGANEVYHRHFIRDNQGRVVTIKDSAANVSGGWDTLTATLYYNGTGTNVVYAIARSASLKDSVVYTYTASRITKVEDFEYDNSTGLYDKTGQTEYTYDGSGNVTLAKSYEVNGATSTVKQERTYQYDAKVSPFKWGADALIIGTANGGRSIIIEDAAGVNNSTRTEFINPPATSGNGSSVTYTYRSDGLPQQAAAVLIMNGVTTSFTSNATYFYQ